MHGDDVDALLEQARNYRRLGNAMYDRHTRLALLELAFEYEERARQIDEASKKAPDSAVEHPSPMPPVQDVNRGENDPETDRCAG